MHAIYIACRFLKYPIIAADDDPRKNTTCDVCGKVVLTRHFPAHKNNHMG